jgi:hypothetical protein
MMNPCHKCIVKVMCKEGCSMLIDYLGYSLTYKFIPHSLNFIASRIREGNISLTKNDTELVSSRKLKEFQPAKDYWVIKFSMMGSDDESM